MIVSNTPPTPAISGTTNEVVKPAKVPFQVEEYYNHVIIGTPGK